MTELKNSINSNNSQKKNKLKQTKEENDRAQLEPNVEGIELKVVKNIETSKLGSQITYTQFGNLSTQTLNNHIILATDKGELIKLDSNGEIKELKKLFGSSPIINLKLTHFINGSNEDSLISIQLNGKLNFYLKFQLAFQLEIGNSPTFLEKVMDSNNGYYLVIGDNLGKVTGFNFKEKLFQFLLKEPKLTFLKDNPTPSITLETCNNPIDQILFINIKDLTNNLGYYYLITNFTKLAYIYSKSSHIHTIYFNNEITRMTKGKFTELTNISSDKGGESFKVLDILISDSIGQIYLLSDLKPTPYLNHGSSIQFMLPYRIKDQPPNTSDYLIITDYSNIVYIYQNQKLITKLPLNTKINQILTISSNGFLSELDFDFSQNSENSENNYDNNDLILLLTSDNNLIILGADFIKMEID